MGFFQKFLKKRKKELPEILLVDKPKGMTSYDVIREIKSRYGEVKIGHSGTLDPLATGLLILGVGEGTKKMGEFLKLPKVYEAHILLGVRTDTGDMEGKILEEKDMMFIDEKEVEGVLSLIVGDIELSVPAYSAVKQGGEPLYKKARRGGKVVPPRKTMKIVKADLLGMIKEHKKIILFIEMEVGSGTYVRSIAEEIGRRLNVPTTVKELRRTSIGDFKVTDACRLEEL
ncbi:MAG: tRNA pseudouridine(55) synthase TruB [Parcubacteria group bacterium]|nr:tRNA pseudouridine(55) synthase TruB [Parcubacteria group bacterium]